MDNAPALTGLKQIRDKYETGYSVGQIKLASEYPRNLQAPLFAKLIEYGTRSAKYNEADPSTISVFVGQGGDA